MLYALSSPRTRSKSSQLAEQHLRPLKKAHHKLQQMKVENVAICDINTYKAKPKKFLGWANPPAYVWRSLFFAHARLLA